MMLDFIIYENKKKQMRAKGLNKIIPELSFFLLTRRNEYEKD